MGIDIGLVTGVRGIAPRKGVEGMRIQVQEIAVLVSEFVYSTRGFA